MKKGKTIQAYLALCIVFFYVEASAQKQANHWFSVDYHLDFNYSPVKAMPNNIPNSLGSHYSSISDYQGKLLFVTNNEMVYNTNLEPMPNAETGINYYPENSFNNNSLIVPRPETNQFYIFLGSSKNYKMSYAVVDMSKNGGLGDVVQKAKDLHIRTIGNIVATGNCSTFWLFMIQPIEDGAGKNRLLRFKIDKNGLNENPDTVNIEGIDYFSSLTFSPDGKSLVFLAENESNYSYESKFRTVLYDFNIIDGSLSNPIFFNRGHLTEGYEFSNDCTKLYASSSSNMLNQFDLFQFDIQNRDSATIENSKTIIFQGTEDYYIRDMRLSSLGSIICQVGTSYWWNKSSIIDFPNKSGIECSFRKDALNFYIFISTNFVSTFLSPQFDENFDISAGESVETCSKSRIDLGEPPTYDIEYSWLPTKYLNNPKAAKPTFLYGDTISVKTDFQYILDAKKGYCHNTDTVTVTVYPDLQAPVSGSKSVCPSVTAVDYWSEADERFRFDWTVQGGELISGQHSDSIKVDWGKSNPSAAITLTPYNELNCASDPSIFPVRINVELQTETPLGEDLLCANLGSGIPYGITNTNGSIYTWESDAGKIISGQGSNQVTVDWPGDGKHKLWVKEQSTTIDTVCYGVSDNLLVNLYTDSTKIEIDFASVSDKDPNAYELQWYVSDTAGLSKGMSIFSASDYSPDWELIREADKKDNYYTFPDTLMNYAPLSFKISSVNGCRQLLETKVHTTIFLEGIADSSSNKMELSWTPYQGWDNNIEAYEIWYAKDKDSQLSQVAKVKPGQTTWSNNWGDEAFLHHYRIRALHSTYPFESWSNELTMSFEHSLEIPNVFTPNGDGINDTFSFPELELFRENELTVIDRYGKEVFTAKNYDGHWNGAGLASGTYYYSFQENHYGKNYKGWIRLLR